MTVTPARRLGIGLAMVAVLTLVTITWFAKTASRDLATLPPTVPGHSRPMMQHDWPHPRDFRFGASAFHAPDVQAAAFKTASGVRAFIIPSELERVVRVTVALPLGRLYERAEEAGAAEFLLQVLTRPGSAGDGGSLGARLESIGLPPAWFQGGLNVMTRPFSGEEATGTAPPEIKPLPDGASLSLEVLPQDWRSALDLLAGLVHGHTIDDEGVRRYRTGPQFTISLTNPAGNGFRPKVELERMLAGYPLAPPEPGRALTPAAVRALAERSTGADQVVFGIGGNVRRGEVEAALNALTKEWRRAPSPSKLAEIPRSTAGKKLGNLQLIDLPIKSGWVAIGRVIDPVPEEDQAALAVMAEILDTRLNINARETRGLTNRNMFVLPETISGGGLVSVRTGARPESIAPLIKLSLEEIVRIQEADAAVTPEEMELVKGALVLGRWQALLDGAPQAASTFALEAARQGNTDRLLRWPAAIEAVTSEQVRAVAQKYLPTTDLTTVVVGPIDAIRKSRHPRWPAVLDEVVRESHAPDVNAARR